MRKLSVLQGVLSALFVVVVLCFFGVVYPHHLHFQEQYQLFLYDTGYASDILSVPGGLADYLGRFITQFYLSAWAGAALLALLFLGVQRVFLSLMQCLLRLRTQDSAAQCSVWHFVLSFVPAILLWNFICDENALAGSIFALLLPACAVYGILSIRQEMVRRCAGVLLLPVVYWAAGGLSVVYVVLATVGEVMRQRSLGAAVTAIVAIILWLVMPQIAYRMLSYPLDLLYLGPHYFRYPQIPPTMLWVAAVTGVLLAIMPLPRLVSSRRAVLTLLCAWFVVMASCCGSIYSTMQPQREELMKYDFWARTEQWNRIISEANRKTPTNQVSVTALNLALGKKGLMADHLFDYLQNGTQGLLAPFQRDPISPLVTAEAFYHLGMNNTAQCYFFEAQEAIPDFQKSARCYKRLAETNIINGNYRVAEKYLRALRKTLLYRSWANEVTPLLYNDEAIDKHPVYGMLRKYRYQEDFFFSDSEPAQVLGRLYLSSRDNRMAFDYLLAAYLLLGDLDSFAQCYSLGQQHYPIQVPSVYQQGFLLWWSRDHSASEPMPMQFRQDIVQGMHQFYTLTKQTDQTQQMKQRFGKSYWYYYFYQRP